MKSLLRCAPALLIAAGLIAQTPAGVTGPAPGDKNRGEREAKAPKIPAGEVHKEHKGGDPLRQLSPKEREKFRDAMRRAWNEPAVLQARDEVKEATIAYQKALTDAIKRTDPDVVALMEKVRSDSSSPVKSILSQSGGPNGRGRPGGGGFRDFEAFITGELPSFLNNLSEEQREIYRSARERALKSPEFQEVFGNLKAMRKNDEKVRNQRIEMFGRVRQILNAQMIAADKRVKEFLPKDHFIPKGPPPSGRRGPGPPRKKPDGEDTEPPAPPQKKD